MFKIYKAEVENQHYRKIKTIRSDHTTKYCGRYDRSGKCSGLFVNFLEEYGIVAQNTMSGPPRQNSVAER